MSHLTLESLAKDLQAVTDRIRKMELERAEERRKHLDLFVGEHALRETILQVTQELAARDGFPVELFVARFEAANHWHRDRFLRTVEGVDPDLAAHLDQREVAEIPTSDQPPCILPER